MTTFELFTAVQASGFSKHVGHLSHLFGATMELAHITGMLLVLSSVLLVSLRLLGLRIGQATARDLADATSGLVLAGLGLLAVSGILILIPAATTYYPNDFFWDKLTVLVFALLVQWTLFRYVARAEAPHPLLGKFTGLLTVGLWFTVAFLGRFIGFF